MLSLLKFFLSLNLTRRLLGATVDEGGITLDLSQKAEMRLMCRD